jgi:hypothetical protein
LRNVFFKNVSRFLKEHGTGIPGGYAWFLLTSVHHNCCLES